METNKRMPVCRIINQQQREWIETNCCPNCGLPKSEWKRRTDWTCCSVACSKKYSEECFRVWQYWKLKAFVRDKYTCVECGFKAMKEQIIHPDSEEYYNKNYIIFKKNIVKEGLKVILGNKSELIADHIIPIAIGGEEYDLSNVQTLCIKCNKVKTKEDMKKIALYRKKEKSQTELNLKEAPSIPPNPKGIGI
jgi:ribosomal protein L37E